MEISPTSLGNLCRRPATLTINKKRFPMFGGNLPHTHRCPPHPPPRSAPVARFSLPSPQTGPGRSGYEAPGGRGPGGGCGERPGTRPPPPPRPPRRRLTAPLPGQRGKEAEARPGRGGRRGGRALGDVLQNARGTAAFQLFSGSFQKGPAGVEARRAAQPPFSKPPCVVSFPPHHGDASPQFMSALPRAPSYRLPHTSSSPGLDETRTAAERVP